MKNTRQQLDIINAFEELGTYRAAARLCGTSDKTVKRVVGRQQTGELGYRARPVVVKNTAVVKSLVAKKVRATEGMITAKRPLPPAKAEGYRGSLRNLRREVARAKAAWRREQRSYRPWQPVAGEYLVADWTQYGRLHLFCAVLPWSRWRFVRFARDEQWSTTLRMFAECFEALGGVPTKVLTDRMSCLKAGVVANMVVPHPEYVRFAAHYRFNPDFCEAGDPESKGVVENLCGYAQRDLAAPLESEDLDIANQEAVRCAGRRTGASPAASAPRLSGPAAGTAPWPQMRTFRWPQTRPFQWPLTSGRQMSLDSTAARSESVRAAAQKGASSPI